MFNDCIPTATPCNDLPLWFKYKVASSPEAPASEALEQWWCADWIESSYMDFAWHIIVRPANYNVWHGSVPAEESVEKDDKFFMLSPQDWHTMKKVMDHRMASQLLAGLLNMSKENDNAQLYTLKDLTKTMVYPEPSNIALID